jgi:hypothetical protein
MTRHPQATTQIRNAGPYNDSATGRSISHVSIPSLRLSVCSSADKHFGGNWEFSPVMGFNQFPFSFRVGAGGCSPPQARENPPPDVHPPAGQEHDRMAGIGSASRPFRKWSDPLCRFIFAPTGANPNPAPVVAGPSVLQISNNIPPRRKMTFKVSNQARKYTRAGRLY